MPNALDKVKFWSEAVPEKVENLRSLRCCLVMVPHPDDESLACAGLIATLVSINVSVKIILTTDGSKSHPNSPSFPSDRLAELRRCELKEALGLLGIGKEAISYYNAPDGNMPTKGTLEYEQLVCRLAEDLTSIGPDLVLVPYELDPHGDHKATYQLLISALQATSIPRPKIWEYPIWLYEQAALDDLPVLNEGELLSFDISPYLALKLRCIYAHRSQTTNLIDDDPHGFILLPEVIENFTQGKEYFMERKKNNPKSTLSKKYFDDVYTNSSDPWDFEKSDYEREKYLTTVNAIPNGNYVTALEIGCSIGVLTKMLIERCEHLLAIDISEVALGIAGKRLVGSKKVEFSLGGIPADFPSGTFDLIVMSEVGYYLSMEDLLLTRKKIMDALTPGGVLILVHWTHFVPDYPLTGDQVHECFEDSYLKHLENRRTEDYRLDVYRKI